MEKPRIDKRLISPNNIVLPISDKDNGILDDYIQTNDKACLEIFTCSICSCLAWDPLCCPKCDKPFCRACLMKYGKNKGCPFKCDSNSYREMTRNEKNYINKIKIKCTNVGCSKYIPYLDYVNHLENCDLRKYHCKNQFCKEEGYINEMINHSKVCNFRMIECSKCKQNFKFMDMNTHQEEYCPEVIIKCKLCGCNMKRGIYIKEHKSDKNENVKCLKAQVDKWTKLYTEEINNKNKEILDLKNKIKQLKREKRAYENENSNLKKKMKEIKNYLVDGYSKFFGEEIDDKNSEKFLNIYDGESLSREYLSTESSFYSKKNSNISKIIYKNDIIGSAKKNYFKVTILNSQENNKEDEKNIKAKIKHNYLQHIKKVQSLSNIPSNCNNNQPYYNNPFK